MDPDRTSPASASSSPSATPSEPRAAADASATSGASAGRALGTGGSRNAGGGLLAGWARAFSRAPLLLSVGLHAVVIGAFVALSGEREPGASEWRPVRIAASAVSESFAQDEARDALLDEAVDVFEDELAALDTSDLPDFTQDARTDDAPLPKEPDEVPADPPAPASRPDDRFAAPPAADLGGPPEPAEVVEPERDEADGVPEEVPADPLDPEPPTPEVDADEEAPPELVDAPAPDYPRMARRRGWEGSVLLELELAADGSVRTALVVESSERDVLDEAALDAVRAWRFVPGRAGRTARHRVTFTLE